MAGDSPCPRRSRITRTSPGASTPPPFVALICTVKITAESFFVSSQLMAIYCKLERSLTQSSRSSTMLSNPPFQCHRCRAGRSVRPRYLHRPLRSGASGRTPGLITTSGTSVLRLHHWVPIHVQCAAQRNRHRIRYQRAEYPRRFRHYAGRCLCS